MQSGPFEGKTGFAADEQIDIDAVVIIGIDVPGQGTRHFQYHGRAAGAVMPLPSAVVFCDKGIFVKITVSAQRYVGSVRLILTFQLIEYVIYGDEPNCYQAIFHACNMGRKLTPFLNNFTHLLHPVDEYE